MTCDCRPGNGPTEHEQRSERLRPGVLRMVVPADPKSPQGSQAYEQPALGGNSPELANGPMREGSFVASQQILIGHARDVVAYHPRQSLAI